MPLSEYDTLPNSHTPGKGLIPRNLRAYPQGCFAYAPKYPNSLILPESSWQGLLDHQIASKSSLYDLRMANYDVLKSLDQNGYGLCWAFSSTKAVMYMRAKMNLPPVRLSAWWVAGKVKGWRDQGGWGGESMGEIASGGVPTEADCPSYSARYDNATVSSSAALNKATQWWDGSDESGDTAKAIMVSAFLLGLPPVLDYNWLSHSMCGCRLVSLNPLTIDCDNSWGETSQYGEKGLYRIQGSRAIPDGIVVPAVIEASLT